MSRGCCFITVVVIASATLAGCQGSSLSSVKPAAVVARQVVVGPTASSKPAQTEQGSSEYLVKRGDTLYSIALDHGATYKDLMAWNNLADPHHIEVGQKLRVVPPENVGAVGATKPSGTVEERALAPAQSGQQASKDLATQKPATQTRLLTEPKVNKVPYVAEATGPSRSGSTVIERENGKPTQSAAVSPPPPEASSAVGATPGAPGSWDWPSQGKVLAEFGSGNKGLDIAGAAGDPVKAAGEGKVVYVGSGLRSYGQMVIIKHGNDYLTAYAHNRKLLVKEGQTVKMGQKIAEMGSSDSDTVKLHFEVRKHGKPVDPRAYLPSR